MLLKTQLSGNWNFNIYYSAYMRMCSLSLHILGYYYSHWMMCASSFQIVFKVPVTFFCIVKMLHFWQSSFVEHMHNSVNSSYNDYKLFWQCLDAQLTVYGQCSVVILCLWRNALSLIVFQKSQLFLKFATNWTLLWLQPSFPYTICII